jgi:hypothetical protein
MKGTFYFHYNDSGPALRTNAGRVIVDHFNPIPHITTHYKGVEKVMLLSLCVRINKQDINLLLP